MPNEKADAGNLATGRARPVSADGHELMDFVVDLKQVGRGDLALVGGKGANLGDLLRGGFPVPAGFVVTTVAYDRFVAHNRLGEVIARALSADDGARIRVAMAASPIPPEVEEAIRAAYEQLGQGSVAVRSSATAEDLPEAAFAGQQDTYLNVGGVGAVLDAVRQCWGSLWTDRAIAYRTRLGMDQSKVKLAVVVQKMVPAEVAGVLFTANPVTGARDEVVIDASPGLGESVVSGLATPDHYVLRKGRSGWSIAERQLGRREVIVRPRAEGGTEREEGSATTEDIQPALHDRSLRELARIGVAIQRHFGAPQDVEWAWADGAPFIVQARPITALPKPPPRPSRATRMLAGLVTEMLPTRPYPLEISTWVAAIFGFLSTFFSVLGVRVATLDRLLLEEDGVVVRLNDETPMRPTPRVLLAPVRLVQLARRYDPARWDDDPLLAEALARTRQLEARDLRALPWKELLATVREVLAIPALIWEFRVRYMLPSMLAVARLRVMLALLGAGGRFGALLFTGIETKTMEANRALEALAASIRSDAALADAFERQENEALWAALEKLPTGRTLLADLQTFLDEYGHRETGGTMQVLPPTWKDAPEVVLGLLRGLARVEPRSQTSRPAWEVARDEVLAHPTLRLSPLRSAFLSLLTRARYFPQLREDTRFYVLKPLPVLRRAVLEIGRRLSDAGVLDAPEDVFHLKMEELEHAHGAWPPPPRLANELRALVTRRKAKRAALDGTPFVDPRLLRPNVVETEVLVRGTMGSPGVVEGPVRVIHDGAEFGNLRPGEVLVAPYTNPAWTPLFQRAIAVVVDSGGPASHAAIVAREYGIPAVMATGDGTRRLVDGQRVRVDGSAGVVMAVQATQHDAGEP